MGEGKREGRMFFFEKKNQKTFIRFGRLLRYPDCPAAGSNGQKYSGSLFQGRTYLMRARLLSRRSLLCGTAASVPALALGSWPALAGADPAQAMLARLCDIVIPDTDTPGARAAGVPAFLPFAFSHELFGGNAETLPALLSRLDAQAGGGGFLAADEAQQIDIITALDHATFSREGSPPVDIEGQRLWRIVKSGIVTSFYTSESGGSRTLAYELVPGRYDADINLHTDPYLSNFWIENIF
jgi:hypothetical protein